MTSYPFQNDLNDDINAGELFNYAIEQGCSDIHLKPGSPPKLRIDGEMAPIAGVPALMPEQIDWIIQQTMVMSPKVQGRFAHNNNSIDYSYVLPNVGRFRINAYKTRGLMALVGRHLIDTPPTFDDLKTNPVIADLTNFRAGLILVSGATGSGKTTLMSAMIQRINSNRSCNIISAEDPIEIVHTDIKSSVSQREVGLDVASFADALKDALREDPDVILIGEIRDEATARAALKAAETGHLVISTIHAINAEKAVTRFLEIFPASEREGTRSVLAGALRGIVGQKLVPRKDGKRVAVNEILLNTPEMQVLLEDHSVKVSRLADLVENRLEDGMQTFEYHLASLYENGVISEQTALQEATSKDKLIPLLNKVKKDQLNNTVKPVRPEVAFSKRANFAAETSGRSSAALQMPSDIMPPKPPSSFKLPPRA